MVSLTLSVSQDLKDKMDQFPEMNWSEVARRAIIQRLEAMEGLEKLAQKSKLTEADAIELSRLINKGVARRVEQVVKKHGVNR
jgi:hypothetical protein